jgi:hypothetical protein
MNAAIMSAMTVKDRICGNVSMDDPEWSMQTFPKANRFSG